MACDVLDEALAADIEGRALVVVAGLISSMSVPFSLTARPPASAHMKETTAASYIRRSFPSGRFFLGFG